MAAAIGLYLLVGDKEPGAEIYTAATKQDQASIVHDEAIRMVRRSPALARRLKINNTTKTISDDATLSKYAALASDSHGTEGLNIHGLIIDEMHVWTDRPFRDSLRYAFAARTQPLEFIITTAGVYDKASLGWEEHERAIAIRDGHVENDEQLVYIVGAERGANILDEQVQREANPSWGAIVDPGELARAAQEAADNPRLRNAFERYRLNIWTEQVDRWLPLEAWDECGDAVDLDTLLDRPCYGGLDLSTTTDITAWVLVWPPHGDDDKWLVYPRFFVPEDNLTQRQNRDHVPYPQWARDGYICATPGNVVDYETVAAHITADMVRFNLIDYGADRWNLEYLRQKLEMPEDKCFAFGQGYQSMSVPAKELERLVTSRTLAHGGHPVLRWMAANVAIEQDAAGNIKPSKKRSTERIDGIVALVMAIGRAMASVGPTQSVYEERGIRTV